MLRKMLKRSMIVGLIVLSTMSYVSATDLQFNLKETGDKSFALYLHGLSTNVQIVLKDGEGRTLYKKQISDKESFAGRFNLVNLNEGGYVLKIEDQYLIKSIPLDIVGNVVTFNRNDVESTFKPLTTSNNSMVRVRMASMNQSALRVVILDSSNDPVFEEVVFSQEDGLNRRYDLSKIKAGEYKFVFYTNGYSITRLVNTKK
jgi:hypothetical protein